MIKKLDYIMKEYSIYLYIYISTIYMYRGLEDEFMEVQRYKSKARQHLVNEGHRIWGIIGDQWSSFEGTPSAERTFKLPNSIYYLA